MSCNSYRLPLNAPCMLFRCSQHIALPWHLLTMMFKQLQRKLARESRELTLSRAPARTLYYFGLTLLRGARQGAHWCISHPVMLFLVLPALALYLAAKHSNYAPDTVQTIEVCVWAERSTGV